MTRLLPNLYKQYFVHNEPDKTRVINSNDIVEKRLEKMAELKRMEQKTTDGNGFSAGIVGPDTDYVEEIDHTAEAKKEAEKILAEAHAQAETILSQADQEAENIRENAKNTGYQEGRQCLESELAAQREQLQNEYQRKQETLQDEFREKQKNMEKDLVDVILEVFNKVFHIQFDNKKHILMYLIDDAILNIEGDKKFRIKVANSNVMFLENHKEEIPCSMRTVYEYIDKCYLSARNIDMHRTVRYKKRTKHEETPKVSPRKKIGHRHDDFLKYIEDHPGIRIVQMDTVEGVKGGKLLQTFLWPENNLMLAYLIDSKEMSNTVRVIDYIEETIGIEEFKELFPVILTDNGSEFADPEKFEKGINGEKRTRLYYCEARHSEQKGELEKNHEYIRYVLPKKTSFDELTQEKIQLMINHINNTSRPKFNGETPINKALKSFDKNAMEKLGLEIILPDEVHLKPELLK